MDTFRVVRDEITQSRGGDRVTITFTFYVEGPPGEHPFALTITWPSGNKATLDSQDNSVPIEESGPTRLSVPMLLENVPEASPCSVALAVAGQHLGDYAFVIE
jgi:hypothetical protein